MENQTVQVNEVKTVTGPVVVDISQRELVDVLFRLKGTTFIGFSAVTIPDMRKTNNRFFGKVEKFSPKINAVIGYQYQNMVNNAQKRQLESDIRQTMLDNGVPESIINSLDSDLDGIVESAHQQFESAGLSWGAYMVSPITGIKSRVLIDHTKKGGEYQQYAQMAILNSQTPVYRWIDSGQELSETEVAELKTFFPDKKEGERQGLAKPYIIRAYALENIQDIRINKVQYSITKSATTD